MKQVFRVLKITILVLLVSPGTTYTDIQGNLNFTVYDAAAINKLPVIALTGDIMMGSFYPDSTQLPAHEGQYLFRHVRDFFQRADVVCGNLEGVLCDTGGTAKKLKYPESAFYFKMPLYGAFRLKEAGFDLVSLANNHVYDFGAYGKNMTKRALDSAGVAYAGVIEKPYVIFEKDSLRYGFIAFAPNSGTVNLRDSAKAVALVRELSEQTDIVIASFHGGGEGTDFRHVTREVELYMNENRGNVYNFAHGLVDAGADVVFGHGPHVTRAAELYNDRIIFYSLGNFCAYGRINKQGYGGVSPLPLVTVTREGVFVKAQVIPIRLTRKGIPVYDFNFKAIKEMQELTTEDFPETLLEIRDDGVLMKRVEI